MQASEPLKSCRLCGVRSHVQRVTRTKPQDFNDVAVGVQEGAAAHTVRFTTLPG